MDPTGTVGATERSRDAGRTDGRTNGQYRRTDGRTEWNQYTHPTTSIIMDISPLNWLDIFSITGSSVILQLRLKISKLQNAMRTIPPFHVTDCALFLSSAMWYTHSGTLSYSILYRTDMPTRRGEPWNDRGNVWCTMLLIHHSIRTHWFIIAQLSNIISPFLASQLVATCHPVFCL